MLLYDRYNAKFNSVFMILKVVLFSTVVIHYACLLYCNIHVLALNITLSVILMSPYTCSEGVIYGLFIIVLRPVVHNLQVSS